MSLHADILGARLVGHHMYHISMLTFPTVTSYGGGGEDVGGKYSGGWSLEALMLLTIGVCRDVWRGSPEAIPVYMLTIEINSKGNLTFLSHNNKRHPPYFAMFSL